MDMKTKGYGSAAGRRLALMVGVFVFAASLAACSADTSGSQASESPAAATNQVKVEPVGKASMGDPREQVAEVSANVRMDITADAGGMILHLLKKNGERVKEGDVIAQFDSRNAQIEKERAEAAVKNAEASLASTSAELKAQRLQATNVVVKLEAQLKQQARTGTQEEIDEVMRSLKAERGKLDALNQTKSIEALQAQLESSKISLKQAQMAWSNGTIIASTSGVLTDVKAVEGMSVQPGSVIGVIQNADKVKLKASLSETAASLARNKDELVFLTSDRQGASRKAKVVYLAELPDSNTRLYGLELEVDNTDLALKPSSRVQVQLTTPEEENVVAVPSLSIVREGSDTFVFLLNGTKAEKRKVELGRINGPYQEVIGGIKVGETLVVSGQHSLQDGQTVEVAASKS
ncbi:efflux RND transporter periplasmic adaptor subunit [Cohnella terricola]|nr:efflux RND transporter periplasmic adaptor subunit [Cohnella terricola]